MKRFFCLGVTIATCIALVSNVYAQEDWVVRSESAACLLENASAYQSSGQDVLMIVMSACPETDINKALALLTQNSAIPGIGVSSTARSLDEEQSVDDIIIYTPAELACLSAAQIKTAGAVTMIPKKPVC